MPRDKNGVEIKVGQRVETDEAEWIGEVVAYGDFFEIDEVAKQDGLSKNSFILVDDKGGFSIEPNWKKCKVLSEADT